ncbi:EAL domain-containing protein [Alginatibacterium sediminis]|uniref:EAL domain-containing protein n=2 Tax=Alginatibacterium sediminis TaxID=2164068 RepID=A0A420E9T7_9ALTE|nr:EAL domain-containing protein [Alginatibacterium sediminis]
MLSAGVMLFSALHLLIQSRVSGQTTLYLSFGAMTLMAATYQLANYVYFNSTSVEDAVIAMKFQVFSVTIFIPLLYVFITFYAKLTISRYWGGLLFVASAIVAVLNVIEPYSIRMSAPVELVQIDVLGVSKSLLKGSPSPYGLSMQLLGLITLIWGTLTFVRLFIRQRNFLTFGFGVFLFGSAFGMLYGAAIDTGVVQGVYIVGYAFGFFVVITSFQISYDSKVQAQRIKQHRALLESVAKGVSYTIGQQFYEKLTLQLSEIFTAKYCYIGVVSENSKRVSTKSFAVDQCISTNFSYELINTPCANVLENKTCIYRKGVQALFSQDQLLVDMEIESYIGMPIRNSNGVQIGIIVLLDTKPLDFPSHTLDVLDIFAARAGAELERETAENTIRRLAYEDYLTQLPNRVTAYEYLEQLCRQNQTEESSIHLYLIDLDHFKVVNDALGHDIGDDVLRSFSRELQSQLPNDIFISRIGGDEFLIIDIKSSEFRLSKALKNVLGEPMVIGDHVIEVNASVGMAVVPQSSQSVLGMLRFAELALYQAKKNGRKQFCIYHEELEHIAKERMIIQTHLKKALLDNRISVHFQPQYRSNGSIYGAEALVRWFDDELGTVSPARFIPIAEETGLIHSLGDYILELSLSYLKVLKSELNYAGHFSINISAWQFALPNFIKSLEKHLIAHDVEASDVVLELTETAAFFQNITETIDKFHKLKQAGFQIALDDFGTGYSSLSYLKDLPIDILKIDKAFVDEIVDGSESPLTESMISIGSNMELDVIAEGVESSYQVKVLTQMGCHIFQGFYFDKPMPFESFRALLEAQNKKSD